MWYCFTVSVSSIIRSIGDDDDDVVQMVHVKNRIFFLYIVLIGAHYFSAISFWTDTFLLEY
jgi:hypothetical protein